MNGVKLRIFPKFQSLGGSPNFFKSQEYGKNMKKHDGIMKKIFPSPKPIWGGGCKELGFFPSPRNIKES